MTECGQTKLHWPHWMQRSGSQTGTLSAMLRFSQAAVPDGKVPSTGIRLTGISSPGPRTSCAVTLRTNSGAVAGTSGRSRPSCCRRGRDTHLVQLRQRIVDGLEIPLHDLLALAAVGLPDRLLDLRDRLVARQHARDGEEAGLQDGVGAVPEPHLVGDLRRRRSRRSAASGR